MKNNNEVICTRALDCVCREVVTLLGLVKSLVPDRLSIDGWLLVDFKTLQRQPHYLRLFSQDQLLHKYITADP